MLRSILILVCISGVAALSAQAPDQTATGAYEVASVKLNTGGGTQSFIQLQPGGTVIIQNVPLRTIITWAYQLGLDDGRLVGLPDWTRTEHFDITAKASAGGVALGTISRVGPPSRGLLILRAILADRFNLEIHAEKREMPVSALRTANADGRLGPKLSQSDRDCERVNAERLANLSGRSTLAPGAMPPCAWRGFRNRLTYDSLPLTELADFLSGTLRRLVVDQTGLTGRFDFDLIWTPDQPPPAGSPDRITVGGVEVDLTGGVAVDPNGPALLTALREQLGLRLESTRAPVEVLVIDSVERPTPD